MYGQLALCLYFCLSLSSLSFSLQIRIITAKSFVNFPASLRAMDGQECHRSDVQNNYSWYMSLNQSEQIFARILSNQN